MYLEVLHYRVNSIHMYTYLLWEQRGATVLSSKTLVGYYPLDTLE